MSDFRPPIENFLAREWRKRGWVAWALTPLACVFGLVAAARRACFALGLIKASGRGRAGGGRRQCDGGRDGQDADRDRARRGAPGSRVPARRGLARLWREDSRSNPCHAAHAPAQVGDEPLLIARRTRAPVVVSPDRVAAAKALLKTHPTVDVIVSDDGLQHYRLARTVELVVFDDRLGGNGFLLPAGPLREPMSRHRDATLVNSPYERTLPPWPNTVLAGPRTRRRLASRQPVGTPSACRLRRRKDRRRGGHRLTGTLFRDPAAQRASHPPRVRSRIITITATTRSPHRRRIDPDHGEGCSKIRSLA